MRYFYFDSVREIGIPYGEELEGDCEEILDSWKSLSQHDGSFLGVFTDTGTILQFMWEADGSVTIDVPLVPRAGSLQKRSNFEESSDAIISAYHGGNPVAIDGLEFVLWKA